MCTNDIYNFDYIWKYRCKKDLPIPILDKYRENYIKWCYSHSLMNYTCNDIKYGLDLIKTLGIIEIPTEKNKLSIKFSNIGNIKINSLPFCYLDALGYHIITGSIIDNDSIIKITKNTCLIGTYQDIILLSFYLDLYLNTFHMNLNKSMKIFIKNLSYLDEEYYKNIWLYQKLETYFINSKRIYCNKHSLYLINDSINYIFDFLFMKKKEKYIRIFLSTIMHFDIFNYDRTTKYIIRECEKMKNRMIYKIVDHKSVTYQEKKTLFYICCHNGYIRTLKHIIICCGRENSYQFCRKCILTMYPNIVSFFWTWLTDKQKINLLKDRTNFDAFAKYIPKTILLSYNDHVFLKYYSSILSSTKKDRIMKNYLKTYLYDNSLINTDFLLSLFDWSWKTRNHFLCESIIEVFYHLFFNKKVCQKNLSIFILKCKEKFRYQLKLNNDNSKYQLPQNNNSRILLSFLIYIHISPISNKNLRHSQYAHIYFS
jgi:hypothetical protein